MKTKKILAIILAAALSAVSLLTGCQKKDGTGTGGPSGTLVIGTNRLNGVFSYFFLSSNFDRKVVDLVVPYLLSSTRDAEPADGIAKYIPPEVINGSDGQPEKTVYTFQILDNVTFSDGTKPTADDLIFSLKVLVDPNYDGKATFYSLPIEGLQEYRYDDPNYQKKLDQIKKDADSHTPTAEEITAAAKQLAEDSGESLSDFQKGGKNYDTQTLPSAKQNYYNKLESEYIKQSLSSGGNKVPDISGVEKVDDRTIKITLSGVDPSAIWTLAYLPVVPQKYYDPDFKKGDLSKVKAKNGQPMGCGPYKFVSYENNVVTLEANENYYKGAPKIAKIKFQVTDEAAKLENVKLGNMDISDPSASKELVQKVQDANLHYELVDNLGYGYIGINAERIPDKNVRKGLMSLMNREPAVKAYYGDELATVLERPMSMVSWAYPSGVKPYYTYSKEKALSYFKAAGYQQVNNKLVKDGKQLKVECAIGELASHPAGPILTQMKKDMADLGAELVIQDVDPNVLFDAMNQRTLDMWVAAWAATEDPDIYQLYSSKSTDNPYRIKNEQLDSLILQARETLDIEKRKPLYAQALDIIMDEAVEMPVYQRKNMYIFNSSHVDIDTLPKDMTPYYDFYKEIQNLQMAK